MDIDELRQERKDKILAFVKDETFPPMKRKEMSLLMEVLPSERAEFESIVDELIAEGKIVETKKGKIMESEKLGLFTGEFIGHQKGFGFVRLDEGAESDIFIPASSVNGTMHKDKVLVRITSPAEMGRRAEGEIVKILEKSTGNIVGTFQQGKGFGFVVCDDRKIEDIFVPKEKSKGAVTGSKVVVKVTKARENGRSPEGIITEIIGHIDDPGVDILSVIKQFDLPIEFPDEVFEQIEGIGLDVKEEELQGRTDFRKMVTVTIDGDDSKDFDDAVSLEMMPNGNYKLGVHIADVTHYVTEGSPLDEEALERGTSVYLVDRVIPMIPHKLSNGICSLNPDEDRLTLSCVMEINRNGDVVDHEICKSVIHSHCRMTYSKVNKVIEFQDAEQCEEYKDFVPMLMQMNELRIILNNKRKKRGSVNFDFPETKIVLDGDGNVLDIKPYERNLATNLIEEFMLVCNETVAEDYYWQSVPFVYRNHETPDEEKIESLKLMIKSFGYYIKGQNEIHPKEIQQLIDRISGKDEEHVISRLVLRSMKQAKYQSENYGHFGLAAQYYCHFTSPIRRYPDLQIHRIIKECLDGGMRDERRKKYSKKLPAIANRCSIRERLADDAERETNKLKMVQYMSEHIGEEFEGIISGVTSWGLYVELPSTVEGMVSINNMDDDYYTYEEKKLLYRGERSGRVYKMGDKARVQVIKTDMQLRTIDFVFVD
ncbi:MAG: ribonuclease R [Firmicutes bacterium]|nr:ribonuclease R [Bacillota bacterium]